MVTRGDTLVGLTIVIISLGICIPSHIIHLKYTQFLPKIYKWKLLYSTGNSTQYPVVAYLGTESNKE